MNLRLIVLPLAAVLAFAGVGSGSGAPQDDAAAAAKGNTAFALDLFRQFRGAEGNLFCSPYSISTALAMTWAGARGETEVEMARTLHFELPQDRLHAAMGALMADLNGRKLPGRRGEAPRPPFVLVTANSLWGQKGYPFRKAFLDLTKRSYGAGLTEADFVAETEKARLAINEWVEEQTARKIRDLIAKGMLTSSARLVLVNAIYFKAAWAEAFRPQATRNEPFHLAADESVDVPTMRRVGYYRTLSTESMRAVELPYEGEELSMVVLVPAKADGLADLEKSATPENLAAWISKLEDQYLDLGMPKFKTTSSFVLNMPLEALGMRKAFRFPEADFSGMADTRELYIGLVIHKAFVDVNEAGTEAAAATAVVMDAGGVPPPPRPFNVDRPFLFLIRDRKTGSLLFLGRVADPRA